MNSKSDSDCLIEKLHDFCLEAFESALSQAGPLSPSVSKQLRQEWQQERGRFVLWGDGAAVRGGELDVRLRDSKEHELHESVVIVLTTMAYTLCSAEGKGNFQNLLAAANHSVPEIAEFIGSEELELEPDELIIEIKESNDSLYDLVPFLGELIESDFKAADLDESPQTSYPGEKVYERNILDKFPALDKAFAESLAQINWIRHVRIRDMALAHQVEGDACSESESDFSSTVPSTVLSSIFDDNDDDSNSAASVSSFATSVAEESGQARIPPPPVPLEHGVEFQCNICFKMQYKIYNKFQWKKHVLQDLQPYSCIAEMCTERGITYGSRRGWVAHEFLHHRCFSEWHCIGDCGRSFSERCEFVAHILEDHLKSSNSGMNIDEIVDSREQKSAYSPPRAINCPFCLEQIEETKRTFQKHVGRHFDEIALKTLPLEVFDAQNEEPEILKDNELSDSDDWSRRSSFLSLDEPVDIKNMTAQTVCTDEDHTIMNGGDAEGSCRGDSVQEKLNPAGKSITDRNVSREDSVGDYSSIAPTTTNNTNDDVDRIVESPPSPDVDRPFFEEPRPLWRTETNSPAPPTSIGITRSNHVVRRRRSAQWLFKGFSVRRDIFRMKLDEDQ